MNITLSVKLCILWLLLGSVVTDAIAEDGYRLWLRYEPVTDKRMLKDYRVLVTSVVIPGDSPSMRAAKQELNAGLGGILGREVQFMDRIQMSGALVVGTPQTSKIIKALGRKAELQKLGK
jgi:alpha-glucuronidase